MRLIAAAVLVGVQVLVGLSGEALADQVKLLQEKLLHAVESGQARLVEEILLEGAAPDYLPEPFRQGRCRSSQGFETWSPYLVVAANHGYTDVLRVLLGYGADVDAQFTLCTSTGLTREGTALMAALVNAHEEVVELLLEHGADTEVVEEMYRNTALTTLAAATRSPEYRLGLRHDMDLRNLHRLLRANADLDWQDSLERTALWLAASAGKTAMVAALVKAGADTIREADCSNEKGRDLYESRCTASRIAAIRGHDDVVRVLEGPLANAR